jgi:hypothetical protein
MAETQFYQPIQENKWPDDIPNKDKFQGGDLDVHTFRWEFEIKHGNHGDNKADDFKVPEGRVLVGWNANVTSCIGCSGQVYQLVMKRTGTRTFPIGIRPGSRLEPGDITGPKASYTGDLTLISVPRPVWNKVADSIPV